MATVIDLAAEFGMTPEAVRQWFQAKGGGRPSGRISSGLARKFREAHRAGSFEAAMAGRLPGAEGAAGRQVSRGVARPGVAGERQVSAHARADGNAGRPAGKAAVHARRVDGRSGEAAQAADHEAGLSGLAAHYEARYQALLAEHRAAVALTDERQGAVEQAEARAAAAEARAAAAEDRAARAVADARADGSGDSANAASVAAPLLRAALAGRGLRGAAAREAVLTLLADERAGEALLDGVRLHDEALLGRLMPVCEDVTCREVAAFDGRLVVDGPCAVCQGSDNRRWWQRMARACAKSGCTRVVVVGGGDQSHAHLGLLARETPEVELTIIDGTSNQTRKSARARVRAADVVVLWSSTILDHRVSDLYRDAAGAVPETRRVVVREGGRGITALAQAVVAALEVS